MRQVAVGLSAVIVAGCMMANSVPAQTPADPLASAEHVSPGPEAIARFAAVYQLIKAAHVEPVEDETLIEAAIHGMLASLDPHSGYLDAQALGVLTDDTLGAYDGLGVEVLSGGGILQVMAAMPDSPAARADLRPGDRITHIDGIAVERSNLDESVRKLRGRPGTRIALTVLRSDDDLPRQIELVRARIRLSSVDTDLIEPGYGHVQVSQCRQETPGELRRRLRQFDRRHGPLHGLVLDLRGNPGGSLDCAIAIADLFLVEGRIVSVEGRILAQPQRYDARSGDAWERIPLAVLIDENTASAAEIIAAALKVNGRAIVLGQRSYGKGSVQNVFALDDSHAVRLTTARYYTADGRSIQGHGVQPDIVLAPSPPAIGPQFGSTEAIDTPATGTTGETDDEADAAIATAIQTLADLRARARRGSDGDPISHKRFE